MASDQSIRSASYPSQASLAASRQRRRRISYAIRYAIAIVLIIFAFVPVVWVISASLNQSGSLVTAGIIPRNAGLQNYQNLVENNYYPFPRWIFNSFYVATIATLLSVACTTLAAYALSRFRFRGRKNFMRGILLISVFPGVLSLIAIFAIAQQLGSYVPFLGMDSHVLLILIYTGGALSINVFLIKGYLDSIPMEIDESALVDGATYEQIFRHIILPLAKPILITVGVLTFMAIYGDFVLPRVLLQSSDNLTVMVGLYLFQSADYAQNWGVFTAGAVVAAVPILLLYLVMQRYIIGGLTTGAVKM